MHIRLPEVVPTSFFFDAFEYDDLGVDDFSLFMFIACIVGLLS